MPIYEFCCSTCNTVYRFLSRTVNTEKTPRCPNCRSAEMRRMVSLFSVASRRGGESSPDTEMPELDESKMEKAMAMLSDEGDMNEEDPRKAAKLMRKLSEATGLTMGPRMEEALGRLERGEDPERIEEEMGDIMEDEEPFTFGPSGKKGGKKTMPRLDETLYEM
jgi:putative FmdB family regulatory protein